MVSIIKIGAIIIEIEMWESLEWTIEIEITTSDVEIIG